MQLKALIELQGGSVSLERVNFEGFTLAMKDQPSAVVLQSGAQGGAFVFNQGSVTLLNDHYEYNPDIILHGFLLAAGLTTIEFQGVAFSFNMVLSSTTSGLLSLSGFRTLLLQDCTFSYNLATSGLLYVEMGKIPLRPYVVRDGKLADSLLAHVQCINIRADHNFAKGALMDFHYGLELPNAELTDVTFENNASGPVLRMTFTGANQSRYAEDTMSDFLVSKRSVLFSNIAIIRTVSSSGLLHIANLTNVTIRDCTIDSNSGDLESGPNVLVLPGYRELDYYLSLDLPFATSGDCGVGILMEGIINVEFANSSVINNLCEEGGNGVSVVGCSGTLEFFGLDFTSNAGSAPQAVALQITDCESWVGRRLTFTDNSNLHESGSGGLYLSHIEEALVSDTDFAGNFGGSGGAMQVVEVGKLMVEACDFEENWAAIGGAVSSSASVTMDIQECVFHNNSASTNGGAIALQSPTSSTLILTTVNSNFTSNVAQGDGSILYISGMLGLAASSYVRESKFYDNSAGGLGGVYLNAKAGQLSFTECNFVNNNARSGSALYLLSKAFLESSVVSGNAGSAAVELGPAVQFTSARVEFRSNAAKAVISRGVWVDMSSTYFANTAGALLLTDGTVQMESANFTSNTNAEDGGAVSAETRALLVCVKCSFTSNRSDGKGGALCITRDAVVRLSQSTIEYNRASEGSALYVQSATQSATTINTGVIRFNKADSATVVLVAGNLLLVNVELAENTAYQQTPGIVATLSIVTATNCVFANQTGTNGVFFTLQADSGLFLTNCTVLNSVSTGRGAIVAVGGNLELSDFRCLNSTGEKAACVYCSDSSLSVSDSTFANCSSASSGLIVATSSLVAVGSCKFADYSGSALAVADADSVKLTFTTFIAGDSRAGAALLCQNCNDIVIQACVFSKLSSDATGAVTLHSDARTFLDLSNSDFRSNRAAEGGALYLDNVDAKLEKVDFTGNTAIYGGALWYACEDDCSFSFAGGSLANNTASVGGALYWSGSKPRIASVSFRQNVALTYGSNIASFPVKIAALGDDGVPEGYSQGSGDPVAATVRFVQSGAPLPVLKLALLDHYGNTVSSESQMKCQLQAVDSAAVELLGETQVTAKKGVCTFGLVSVVATPGTQCDLRAQVAGLSVVLVHIVLRNCTVGEQVQDRTCQPCSAGTYSLQAGLPCKPCPTGAVCYGNSTVAPLPGYWRSSVFSLEVLRCLEPAACAGSPLPPRRLALTGLCTNGYTGNLCASCSPGFSHNGLTKCEECLGSWKGPLKVVLLCVCALVVLHRVLKSAPSAFEPSSTSCGVWKVLLTHTQCFYLLVSLQLTWPAEALHGADILSSAVLLPEPLFSVNCLLSKPPKEGYRDGLVLVALLPAGVMAFSAIWCLVHACVNRTSRNLKNDFAACSIVLMFMLHPNLAKAVLEVLVCVEIDPGQRWLLVNLETQCWSQVHRLELYALALPSLFAWVLGAPLLCALLLIKLKRKADSTAKAQFGFLIAGYRADAGYSEFAVYAYKTLLAACASLLSGSSHSVQGVCALLILIGALLAHQQVQPMVSKELNILAAASLLAQAGMVFGSLLCAQWRVSSWLWPLVFWAIFAAFLCLWMFVSGRHLVARVHLQAAKKQGDVSSFMHESARPIERVPTRVELCLGRFKRESPAPVVRTSFEDFRPVHMYSSPPPKKARKPASEEEVRLSDRGEGGEDSSVALRKEDVKPFKKKPANRYNSEANQASKGLFEAQLAAMSDRPSE